MHLFKPAATFYPQNHSVSNHGFNGLKDFADLFFLNIVIVAWCGLTAFLFTRLAIAPGSAGVTYQQQLVLALFEAKSIAF